MPKAIVILDFDQFEGAVLSFKYPPDFEVADNIIQQINISHNFVTSIMVHEYEGKQINAISQYNEETLKTIVLFLKYNEDGQDFYEIINQVDDFLSKIDISQENYKEELVRLFKISLKLVGIRDQVMSKLANEVANSKMLLHDFNNRITKLLELSNNIEISILLTLSLTETRRIDELYNIFKGKKKNSTVLNAINSLEKKRLIRKKKEIVQINF